MDTKITKIVVPDCVWEFAHDVDDFLDALRDRDLLTHNDELTHHDTRIGITAISQEDLETILGTVAEGYGISHTLADGSAIVASSRMLRNEPLAQAYFAPLAVM